MIGRVLSSRYKILQSIGEGGMSRVWRAQDQNTGKAVAVKVLREEFREDETFVRRFEREALAASRMTHPNIANLLDVGVDEDGARFLVIEFVSGKTLKQFIQESGAIRPDTAAQIIIRVLAAVQHAHQNGVIHRDIKPQNILIDKEGTVKVTDFGIARVANSQTMNQDAETVMGSVYYFSPEQAKGAIVDEKSDLYSVGVVLYEMLTGQVPFTGDTPVTIAMKHLHDTPVSPHELNPAVSTALDFVVMRALSKQPRRRYASAADMQREVRLALEDPETILGIKAEVEKRDREAQADQERKARAQNRTRRMRRALLIAFSVLLLCVIALAGYTITNQILLARRNQVEVPSFLGKSKAAAVNLAIELRIEPYISEQVYTLAPEGTVYDQSIAPGSFVKPGEIITLFVCKSQFDLSMPNVVGMLNEKGQKTILDLGLVVGDVRYTVNNAMTDTIIAQDPPTGTPVHRGDTVTLTVSEGLVSMPKLIGMTLGDAEQSANSRSLIISGAPEQVTDDPKMVGKVVNQLPRAYEEVRPNSTVQIWIGTPGDQLIEAEVILDLSELPAGGTVVVSLVQEDGTRETFYTSTFDTPERSVPIYLYSKTERSAIYEVFFNGEMKYANAVIFSR